MNTTIMDEAVMMKESGMNDDIIDYYNVAAPFAAAIGVDIKNTNASDAIDQIIGFNARESTDAVLAAFDRAERVLQVARAIYAESPSHADPGDTPADHEHCVMQAISEVSGR